MPVAATLGRMLVASVLALLVIAGCALMQSEPQATGALLDFQQRVGTYMTRQRELQTGDAATEQTKDPAEIYASTRALAARIRTARADARQGDIFSPAVAAMLRRAMNSEVRGPGAANTRASIRGDAPSAFRLEVNADYPEGATLPSVPPNVLAILPTLPDGLEYRIVDMHLILRDRHANVVVD
jgi:hypothetical protein